MLLNASEGDPQTATGMSEAISCWGGRVVTTPFPGSWCTQGFVCAFQASPESMRFDLNMTALLLPSCHSFSFALGFGVPFFGVFQHSPIDVCSAASCDFGVLAG